MTTKPKGVGSHVAVKPPEGGLRSQASSNAEDIRSVSVERLGRRLGAVGPATMEAVSLRLRILLDL